MQTLEPRWNEVMCFAPQDVAEALAARRAYVALRVYDWDLLSSDDFLVRQPSAAELSCICALRTCFLRAL